MKNNQNSNVELHPILVEQAVQQLRMRVSMPLLSKILKLLKIIRMAIVVIIKSIMVLYLGFFALYAITGNPILFALWYFGANELLFVEFVYRVAEQLKHWKSKGSILIGKSYTHSSETVISDGRKMHVDVGIDGKHYIDYMNQPNHHVLINGSTSSGKTVTMLTFVARASLMNNLKFLMIDWNGENEEWGRNIGATVWKVPLNFKINLFKLNGLSKEDRAGLAVESLMVAAQLTPLQSTRVRSALLKFYQEGTEPSLFEMWESLCTGPSNKINNVLNQRLRAIQRVIGYEPKEFWEEIFNRNNIISLAGLNESEKTLAVYAIMQRLAELFDKTPELGKSLKLMVIIDEAWQFFKREKEFDAYKESSLEKVVRLGRKYGFGLIVSTQQVEDVPKVFINSCSLIMLHQQRETTFFGGDILNLDRYEMAYLKSAAQGEMILFDRGMGQVGQTWNEYIRVRPLSVKEARKLAIRYEAYVPKAIDEPEMPIELHDTTKYKLVDDLSDTFKELDIPSVAIYRFLITLSRTLNLAKAYKMIKDKGWVTSDTTIYGNKAKPSILDRAIVAGYVNDKHEISKKAFAIIDPDAIIEKQGMYQGSEEHKELMKRTIRMIQERGNFAFTTSDKDSFDVGEVKSKSKGMWDFENLTIYECQTNSVKEEIEKGVNKAKALNAGLVWVCGNQVVLDEIRRITEGRYGYVNVDDEGEAPSEAA